MRHRAAAEMVGCRFALEPPFLCLVRRSFNEGGPPRLPFQNFLWSLFLLRLSQKEKADQEVGKILGHRVNAKSLFQNEPQEGFVKTTADIVAAGAARQYPVQ